MKQLAAITDALYRSSQKSFLRKDLAILVLIGTFYFLLVGPTLTQLDITHDEVTDLKIAASYLKSPLKGSIIDTTQTRLPMYLGAAVAFLTGDHSVLTHRWVSCIFGFLTILAVYVYTRAHFSFKTACLASVILAASPYFLSNARIAFTESDIFLSCFLTWAVVFGERFLRKPTLGSLAVLSVFSGLALSAKFTGIVIFPVVSLCFFYRLKKCTAERLEIVPSRQIRNLRLWVAGFSAIVIAIWIYQLVPIVSAGGVPFIKKVLYDENPVLDTADAYLWSMYIAAFALWAGCVGTLISLRRFTAKPAQLLGLYIFLGLGTFLIIPPPHLTNIFFVLVFVYRSFLEIKHGIPYSWGIPLLHFLSPLFNSSLAVGAFLWLSVFLAWRRWRAQTAVQLPLLIFWSYLFLLLKMESSQSFHMIPVLPVMVILASVLFFRFFEASRAAALVVGTVCLVSLGGDYIRYYPHLNWVAYHWLGERYLARMTTLGNRAVIDIRFDGLEQTLQWVIDHVPPDRKIVALGPTFNLLREKISTSRLNVVFGIEMTQEEQASAEYIIIHVSDEIQNFLQPGESGETIYKYPYYDVIWLKNHYEKIYSFSRCCGVELASVWRKKKSVNR